VRTMLLAAAAALTLNAGAALADSGDSFNDNRSPVTQANSAQVVRSAQSQIAVPNGMKATVIAHGLMQSQDTRTGSVFDPINSGSG
jgi:hypothetical protein